MSIYGTTWALLGADVRTEMLGLATIADHASTVILPHMQPSPAAGGLTVSSTGADVDDWITDYSRRASAGDLMPIETLFPLALPATGPALTWAGILNSARLRGVPAGLQQVMQRWGQWSASHATDASRQARDLAHRAWWTDRLTRAGLDPSDPAHVYNLPSPAPAPRPGPAPSPAPAPRPGPGATSSGSPGNVQPMTGRGLLATLLGIILGSELLRRHRR